MAYATWLADVLRGAGLQVVEHPGWRTRGNGDYTDLYAVVWHHDASPPGDSPGVPDYMIRNFNVAGAQCWVDRTGAWHLVAAGVAYHAGAVLPGMPGNRQSIGVETDHTTGEDWPPALLRSLRVGTTAILRRLGSTPARGLHFHKTICSPKGRKVDPDRLDLATERAAIGATTAVLGSRIPDLDPDQPAPVEDFMPQLTDAEQTELLERVRKLTDPAGIRDVVWDGRNDKAASAHHVVLADAAIRAGDASTKLDAVLALLGADAQATARLERALADAVTRTGTQATAGDIAAELIRQLATKETS